MLLREQAHGVGIVGLVSGAEGEPSGTSGKRETWGMGETEEVVLSCEFWALSCLAQY
jgi:hypothetical protein